MAKTKMRKYLPLLFLFFAITGCGGEKTQTPEAPALTTPEIKAIHTEALTTLGAIARSQQAYRLEFGSLPPDTSDYAAKIGATQTANWDYTSSLQGESSIIVATPKKEGLDPHIAFVYSSGSGFEQIICKSPNPIPNPVPMPSSKNCPDPLLPPG